MTRLRQRLLEELQRRNYAPDTTRGYILAVKQFAEYFGKSPDRLGPEQVRRFQLHLLNEKRLSAGTVKNRMSALRFFYRKALKRRDLTFDDLPFPRIPVKLPTVLSREEVTRLIDAAANLMHQTILIVLYGTGVRRTEAARLKVSDIDSQRMVIHIHRVKAHGIVMFRSVLNCSMYCASTGVGRNRRSICFPVPWATRVWRNPSRTRPSGTPAVKPLSARA